MLFGKIFSNSKNVRLLLLELLMIFIGVYLAFLFQNYSEDKKISKEKEKVLVSLKLELETFRTTFPGFSEYQKDKNAEWDSVFAAVEMAEFYTWRYLEPQYNFQVIEYALDQERTEVVDFELYDQLAKLYSSIKRLEHAERMMTEHGQRYRNINRSWSEESLEYKARMADNRFNFYKFRIAAIDRANIMERISKTSEKILEVIHEDLGADKIREADINLLHTYLEERVSRELIREVYSEYFPHFTNEETESIIEEWDAEKAKE